MAARGRGFDEPNYTQTPNLLFDVLLPGLGLAELKVLLVVVRDTFGWHRDLTEPLSLSRFMDRTGLGREAVVSAIKKLIDAGLLRRREKGGSFIYQAVINEQMTLGGPSSVSRPPGRVIEPPAGQASEPNPVGSSNQRQSGRPTTVKESLKEQKKDPPSPFDEAWQAVIEDFEGSTLALSLNACRLVSIDPFRLEGPSSAVGWIMGERRGTVEAALRERLAA